MTVKEIEESMNLEVLHLGNGDAVISEPYCCDLLSVAMGNAQAPVKAAADYQTADNDHDGVGLAVEKFILSEEN